MYTALLGDDDDDNPDQKKIKDLVNIENVIKALRKEIGLSNQGLGKFDILQMYVIDDLKKAFKKKKNQ